MSTAGRTHASHEPPPLPLPCVCVCMRAPIIGSPRCCVPVRARQCSDFYRAFLMETRMRCDGCKYVRADTVKLVAHKRKSIWTRLHVVTTITSIRIRNDAACLGWQTWWTSLRAPIKCSIVWDSPQHKICRTSGIRELFIRTQCYRIRINSARTNNQRSAP